MSEKNFVAVAKLEDVPAGTKKLVVAGRTEIVLCHTLDKFFAVENLCSHAHEKLDCGKMRNGVALPCHADALPPSAQGACLAAARRVQEPALPVLSHTTAPADRLFRPPRPQTSPHKIS